MKIERDLSNTIQNTSISGVNPARPPCSLHLFGCICKLFENSASFDEMQIRILCRTPLQASARPPSASSSWVRLLPTNSSPQILGFGPFVAIAALPGRMGRASGEILSRKKPVWRLETLLSGTGIIRHSTSSCFECVARDNKWKSEWRREEQKKLQGTGVRITALNCHHF